MHPLPTSPLVGIVGSAGDYGRWMCRFLAERMGLTVLGSDPADPGSVPPAELVARADVLVFSAPIRKTPALIREYVGLAGGRERGRLWLDLTSVKVEPVAAMLQSQAEVAGLHPMAAPPKAPSLRGRVLVVCEARLERWRGWLQALLDALEAECVRATPDQHDRIMALVQAMGHATRLAGAGVLRGQAAGLGGLDGLLPFRSAAFEMDAAVMARILSLNPAIYEDIQFCNPHVDSMLQQLREELAELHALVRSGDDAARQRFRQRFLEENRRTLGAAALEQGNYGFERIGYLLADLAGRRVLSVHLPRDCSGELRALLAVFERHGISLASIHSSRTPAGEVHFRIGFDESCDPGRLRAVAADIDASGIGRVL